MNMLQHPRDFLLISICILVPANVLTNSIATDILSVARFFGAGVGEGVTLKHDGTDGTIF